MGEKRDHCYGNNFIGVSKEEINCVILNAIFFKKINFVHHYLVYTETRRKQPLPKNFLLKMFHYFLKRTIGSLTMTAYVTHKDCIFALAMKNYEKGKYYETPSLQSRTF